MELISWTQNCSSHSEHTEAVKDSKCGGKGAVSVFLHLAPGICTCLSASYAVTGILFVKFCCTCTRCTLSICVSCAFAFVSNELLTVLSYCLYLYREWYTCTMLLWVWLSRGTLIPVGGLFSKDSYPFHLVVLGLVTEGGHAETVRGMTTRKWGFLVVAPSLWNRHLLEVLLPGNWWRQSCIERLLTTYSPEVYSWPVIYVLCYMSQYVFIVFLWGRA